MATVSSADGIQPSQRFNASLISHVGHQPEEKRVMKLVYNLFNIPSFNICPSLMQKDSSVDVQLGY